MVFNYGNYETQCHNVGFNRFSVERNQTVKVDYDLPLSYLESYFTNNEIESGYFFQAFKEYKGNILNHKQIPFSSLLQYFSDKKLLNDNKEFYSELAEFLEYASDKNQLHRKKREHYENFLKRALFEDNKNSITADNLESLEALDYNLYEDNNFAVLNQNNEVILDIHTRNGAIFLNSDGKICCRFSKNSEFKTYSPRLAEIMLSKELGYGVKIVEDHDNNKNYKNKAILFMHDLMLVHREKFRPRILQEYFQEDGVWYKNTFKPTRYMQLTGESTRLPKTILDLLFHLVNYEKKKYDYLLNNLAYFFQYLKKSQIAIALIGKQGAGKGILFDNILSELFGKEYCITINNESINSRYKAKIIKDKLYYNFDEIKLRTSEKNDSFIKAIITNPSISLEEKNVTMSQEIELFGQCLFSSNHMDALKIEENDRRFTVINTGENLTHTNFLHYGSYENLVQGIKLDLEEFARYLKNYEVDKNLANTPLDTYEKRMIINSLQDNLIEFHRAIIDTEINYFRDLQTIQAVLYSELYSDFENGKINRVNIAKAYNALFSKSISSKELLKKMRAIEPYNIFQEENLTHSGNTHYYNLAK